MYPKTLITQIVYKCFTLCVKHVYLTYIKKKSVFFMAYLQVHSVCTLVLSLFLFSLFDGAECVFLIFPIKTPHSFFSLFVLLLLMLLPFSCSCLHNMKFGPCMHTTWDHSEMCICWNCP